MAKTSLSPRAFAAILLAKPSRKAKKKVSGGIQVGGADTLSHHQKAQKTFEKQIPVNWTSFIIHIYSS
jgi:hypothetical protein